MKYRGHWKGWSDSQLDSHLNRVLCLSRFFIRPSTRCRNLASLVLGMAMRRLADDFKALHGYRPWALKTCIAPGWDGACLRATNFERTGQTAGRGRGALAGQDTGAKALYAYSLEPSWHDQIGRERAEPVSPLQLGKGMNGDE